MTLDADSQKQHNRNVRAGGGRFEKGWVGW